MGPFHVRYIHMDNLRMQFTPALVSLLMVVLASCSVLTDAIGEESPFGGMGCHEVLIILPASPPAWTFLGDLRMALTWRDPGGRMRSALALPGTTLRIEVDRGIPQAILALPAVSGRGLMPAGALYPEALAGKDCDELVLDWKGGYAASVALALVGGGVDPWGYDLSRLAEGALTRSGDPWLIPALEAARRLVDLDFRIDAFTIPPRHAVNLPGPGPWAPESPFAAAPQSLVALLPEGLWRFLGGDGELVVSVDADGGMAFVRR